MIYPTFEKTFQYDARGRKIRETDKLDATTSYQTRFEYDAAGNLMFRTDKEEKVTGYGYDDLNRLTAVTDPNAQTTVYTYDERDNLTALTDAENQTTQFVYDLNNRLKKEIRPMNEETGYTYDAAGNLIQKVDAKLQKTTYEYDDAGRLEYIRYFNNAIEATPVKTVQFTYDKVGNLKTYDDGTTTATYDYDELHRKIAETVNYGTFSKSIGYTYFANGSKKTFTGPDNTTITYDYDPANQVSSIQIPGAGAITIPEYTWTRPKTVTLPGGGSRSYDYDPLMRVKSILAKDPGANTVLAYNYSYDKMDNIVQKATEHGDYDYGYDDLYRLTSSDNPVQDDETFTYDNVGNRTTSADVAGDWGYNDNNELESYGGVTFVYDDNGNTIEKNDNGSITRFFYNVEDRLVRVEDGSGTVIAEYGYDPFGRRLWKDVGGSRTYFAYADEGLVAEMDATGTVTKTYGWKPNSTWSTDPLFMREGGSTYFYQNDHLGTPQKITSVSGAVVWSAKYSSFGKADVDAGSTVVSNLRFAGQYFDGETGLHYNYYRYYNPKVGRYNRRDPINFAGRDVNLYRFVEGNPANSVDPLGLLGLRLHVKRVKETKHSTVGELYLNGKRIGNTLELPWRNNQNFVSRIPEGCYHMKIRRASLGETKHTYDVLEILDVPGIDGNRTDVEIHIGNKPKDTEGCVLPGKSTGGKEDWVSSSKVALDEIFYNIELTQAFSNQLGEETELTICISNSIPGQNGNGL